MPVPHYAAKRDSNENEIIDALESRGYAVLQLDKFDLLVFDPRYGIKDQRLFMLEVKNPKGKDRGESRTAMQQKIVNAGFPLHYVTTVAEALAAVGEKP